jgi:hypothetical protein
VSVLAAGYDSGMASPKQRPDRRSQHYGRRQSDRDMEWLQRRFPIVAGVIVVLQFAQAAGVFTSVC